MRRKGFALPLVFVVIAVVLLLGGGIYFLGYYLTCTRQNNSDFANPNVKSVSTGINIIQFEPGKSPENIGQQIAEQIIQEVDFNTRVEALTSSPRVDFEIISNGFKMRGFGTQGEPEEIEITDQPEKFKFKFKVAGWLPKEKAPSLASTKDLEIKYQNGKFRLGQDEVEVETTFSLTINNSLYVLIVTNPSRNISSNVKILPKETLDSLISLNIVDKIDNIELIENENSTVTSSVDPAKADEVVYRTSGSREIKLFGIFSYRFPIKANLTVTSGQVQDIKRSSLANLLLFIFRGC